MVSPFEISADEIETWSSTKVAEAALPKLVRRLVAASLRRGSVRFRADAGVRLPGFDGIVNAPDPAFFCPSGLSVWELSVKQRPREKADKDFEGRVAKPVSGVVYSDATYVAVTGRRFPEREKWQAEKRRRGIFADVLAYDADDLAQALEQAPAVAIWFAEILGRPVHELLDAEAFLARWSRETRPALPPSVLVADRDDAVRAVRSWLEGDDPSPLRVEADTREEAAAFIAAVVSLDTEVDRLSRFVFVETLDAWRSVTRGTDRGPLLLVPLFEPFPTATATDNVRLVIPVAGGPRAAGAVSLTPLKQAAVCQALTAAGLARTLAEEVSRSSRGKLAAVKRLCDSPRPPAWGSGDPLLLATLLIGSWQPARKADRDAVEALGVSPEDADARSASLSRTADPPIERHGDAWRWTAPKDAWNALAPHLGELLLGRFRDVAIDVLGRPVSVGPFGSVVPHSADLRRGVAESLVRLALNDDELKKTLGRSRGTDLAESVLRSVLKKEWQAWASLTDLLPTLAEAAPSRFLDALDDSLDAGDAGAAHLTAEEQSYSYPHVGLLWALETLGWSPDLLQRVAVALARLAAHDPGGNVANRPGRSLSALLHWTLPQTTAPVAERIATLKVLFRRHPKVARAVALGHLGNLRLGGMMTNAHRPKLRSWDLPAPGLQAPGADAYAQVSETLDLLLADAAEDGERWASLIEPIVWLPDALRERAVAALEQRAERLSRSILVVSALRERLHWLNLGTRSPDLIGRYEKLYELLVPADEVERSGWLFEPGALLPEKVGDWRAEEARRDELRREAVQRIWSHDERWRLLQRLAAMATAPWLVASAIARLPFANECETTMRSDTDGTWDELLPIIIAARIRTSGGDVEQELRSLVDAGRTPLASRVALGLDANRGLWGTLARVSNELAQTYWRRAPTWVLQNREEAEVAIRSLLEVARADAAGEIASHAAEHISSATALLVLDALRTATGAEVDAFIRRGSASYHVERVFEVLDRDPDVATDRIVALEVTFMTLLEDSRRKLPNLSRALGTNHENFLALVRTLYRAEGEAKPEGDVAIEKRSRADVALRVLRAWDGVPGDHLPDESRQPFLLEWCRAVLRALSSEGRETPAIVEVGKVLARAPVGADGIWPCTAAREVIDSGEFPALAKQLPSDKYNLRGCVVKSLDEGGLKERDIAAGLRADASRLKAEYPRTAAMLVAMADDYCSEAEVEDMHSRLMLDQG